MYRSESIRDPLLEPGIWLVPPRTKLGNKASRLSQNCRSSAKALHRIFDIVIASVSIFALLPLFLLVGILIKLQDGGSVIFSQERVGQHGRRFVCWKFRSMRPDAEQILASLLAADPRMRRQWDLDHKLKNDPRITRLGDFLRRSSLDELPQLLNVIRGDMSIVGPRPIVESEICRYGRWYRYYISVKPGITGLWQISGRNNIDYKRRVAMDRLFFRAQSSYLFLYILIATVPAVLGRRGAY